MSVIGWILSNVRSWQICSLMLIKKIMKSLPFKVEEMLGSVEVWPSFSLVLKRNLGQLLFSPVYLKYYCVAQEFPTCF